MKKDDNLLKWENIKYRKAYYIMHCIKKYN